MNGYDSEEQLTRQREILEDAIQKAKELEKETLLRIWADLLNLVATGLVIAGIGYLVYVAIGG